MVRKEIVALIERGLGADELRAAIGILDEGPDSLSASDELIVARQAAPIDPARAVRGFVRAARQTRLKDADRLTYGAALARSGRHREALTTLALIRAEELVAQASSQRARSLLSLGQRPEAIALLRRIFTGDPTRGDSTVRAQAGYVAADLLSEDGNEAAARELYRGVAERFPRSSYAVRAAFQAAMIAWVAGDRALAGREYDSLANLASEHSERAASLYWSGRVLNAQGDTTAAQARWRSILQRFPSSYYAYRALERLRATPPDQRPAGAESSPDPLAAADFDRAALLERLGLRAEARLEYDWLTRRGSVSPTARISMAQAFQRRGMVGRAYRLAAPVVDSTSQQFAFPLIEIPFLLEEARLAQVDPLLAAAIIRQESGYELSARSRADARGWMQVLPSLGASMARGTGIREWDPALLHQAEINLRFGMAHLSSMLKRLPRLPMVLAAYNAGSRAAERWANIAGAADDEVYIERIQYTETRDYVRRVLANLAAYRALYGRTPD
jgi:soluble lytic murein transglycosylase